ncbi:MAG: DegT/DnrJ/EryC1/StrS family aminotransferase [Candidatus Omnitrophica bacterium]|nr:DegT/DnrJ/EryC1/StrS family aminotransferase [Candidatus Omnitrophota bacterium]
MISERLKEVPPQRFGVQFEAMREEIMARIERVCQKGQFILGPEVKAFEETFARWLGAGHGIGVASGSDALLLALLALEIGPGDEVITTPFTYFATGESIVRAGARPVFVDIDPKTYNLRADKIEEKINARTKAILPVHIYGQPCRMDAVLDLAARKRLAVVEDCAQAHGTLWSGRKVGTFGDYGCFSFYPTKNLGAYGDGGFVAAREDARALEVRILRSHGALKKYHHEKLGINSRLDEIQAAILNVKLKFLDQALAARRQRAHRYNELLRNAGLTEIQTPYEEPQGFHTYHLYVIRAPRRDALLQHLEKSGIGAGVYYPFPLHLEKPFAFLGYGKGLCPEAEKASLETLALPLFPEMTDDDQDYVVERVAQFYRG